MFSSNTQPPSFKIVNSDHQTSCCIFLLERFVSLAKVIRKKLNVTLISLPPIHICIMCMRTCTLTQCIYTCIYIYIRIDLKIYAALYARSAWILIYQYTVYIYSIYIYGLHFRARHHHLIGTLHPCFFSSAGPRLGISRTWIGPRDEFCISGSSICKT